MKIILTVMSRMVSKTVEMSSVLVNLEDFHFFWSIILYSSFIVLVYFWSIILYSSFIILVFIIIIISHHPSYHVHPITHQCSHFHYHPLTHYLLLTYHHYHPLTHHSYPLLIHYHPLTHRLSPSSLTHHTHHYPLSSWYSSPTNA